MGKNQNWFHEFNLKKLLIAKVLGVACGSFFLLVLIYLIIHPLPYGNYINHETTLIEWFLFILVILSGPAGIMGGFLNKKHPIIAGWLLISSGLMILVLFFALALLGLFIGLPLILSGCLTLASISNKTRETELAQLKVMVSQGNYSEALPRIYKLSRINPDDPEVRFLIKTCREHLKG